MFEKTLPIGSVVELQNAQKRIMIVGYFQYKQGAEGQKIYDYVGCPYPNGFISYDQMILFDHDKIEHIYALGYQNGEQFAFTEKLKEAIRMEEEKRNA